MNWLLRRIVHVRLHWVPKAEKHDPGHFASDVLTKWHIIALSSVLRENPQRTEPIRFSLQKSGLREEHFGPARSLERDSNVPRYSLRDKLENAPAEVPIR